MQAGRYISEAGRILNARSIGGDEVGRLPFGRSNLYPEYYQNNFHYQTGAALQRLAGSCVRRMCSKADHNPYPEYYQDTLHCQTGAQRQSIACL